MVCNKLWLKQIADYEICPGCKKNFEIKAWIVGVIACYIRRPKVSIMLYTCLKIKKGRD